MADDDTFDLYDEDSFLPLDKHDDSNLVQEKKRKHIDDDLFEGFIDNNNKDSVISDAGKNDISQDSSIGGFYADQSKNEDTPKLPTILSLSDLGWWVSENNIRDVCNQAGIGGDIKELQFQENKSNGKSKGKLGGKYCIVKFINPDTPFSKLNESSNTDSPIKKPITPQPPISDFRFNMIPPAQLVPGLPHMPPIPNVPMNRMPMNFAMPMGFQMNNMAMNQHNLQMHQHMVRSQLAAQMRPGMVLPQMPMNVGPHRKSFSNYLFFP
ncbi:hypothetical protein AYI70_g2283 [Smittium culicis]|uniref:Uncharacterized protein n=1 Tax=Smittium culicis TaxID=133412 RepID=A0A1R1Y967_9FUNG|nr:hypothetical protein AYI70_g2283 [Smittium culicis]